MSTSSALLLGLAFLVPLLVQIAAVVDVATRGRPEWKRSGQNKMLWLLFALFVPTIGALAWWLWGRKKLFRANGFEPAPVFPPRSPVPGPPSNRTKLGKLYHGETTVDIVGRARLWFAVSGAVIVIGLAALGVRGLNLGIDFEGGVVWEFPAATATVDSARDAAESFGLTEPKVQTLTSDDGQRIRVQAEPLGLEREQAIAAQFAEFASVDRAEVSLNSVGPSWGEEITRKAARALVFFLIAITAYVTFRFEFKMALATLAALLHDVLVTVGVYAISGFEVTPATVIAILTILGFSIYDGIVVFDKVDENTRIVSSTNRITYSDMVNISLNQTLMRSLNTQITALLPMISLLVVGSFILGATTLQEFAVALLVGQFSGAYSSLFIASPLLALLKEREPRYRDVRRRIEARDASRGPIEAPPVVDDLPETGAEAGADADADEPEDRAEPARVPVGATKAASTIPPRPRKKGKRR